MNHMFDREAERLATVIKLADAPAKDRDKLIEEYRRRSEEAFAPATRRNYHQMIRMFGEWCHTKGYSSLPPVPPTVIAEYVDFLGSRVRATTIETRLWALGELHRAEFQVSPCRHRLVELALKSVKRKYGAAIRQAPPLGKKEVLKAIAGLGQRRIDIRDKAALWLASDTWCRGSELSAFRVKDLIRQEDGTSLMFVHRSKTDPYGQGAYAFLSEPGTLAVLRWIELAELGRDEPVLTKSQRGGQRTPLDPKTISKIVKRATGRQDVSVHSMRVGGVQDAFRLGCDLSSIMVAGRWTSPEMPARYGRRIVASQSAAAQVAKAFTEKST